MKTRNFYHLLLMLLFAFFTHAGIGNNGIIKGIAYDEKNLEILNNTALELYSGREFKGMFWCQDDGIFTIRELDTGWYVLVVTCEDYQTRKFDSIRIDSNTLYLIYPELKNIKGYYLNNYNKGEVISKRFTQPNYMDLYYPFYGLKIYPNPVQDYLTIDRLYNNVLEVKIFDMNGNIFSVFKLSEKYHSLSLQHLPKGMYTIQFVSLDDQKDIRFIKLE